MLSAKNFRLIILINVALLSFSLAPVLAADDTVTMAPQSVMVGGAEMLPGRSIIENASQSKDHTTLVLALKTAGLAETLSGPGPYTVFAPTNAAFAKLPTGTMDSLMKPENKERLRSILNYHVVPGRLTAADLESRADENNGKIILKTAEGGDLTVMKGEDDQWWVQDENGNKAQVQTADVMQSNGVIFITDTVLMPKAK